MKKIILIFYCVLIPSIYLSAQSRESIDPRLREFYSDGYLTSIQNSHPQEIKYMNWYLDNSYSIEEIPEEKNDVIPYLKHFNPQTKTVGDIVENVDSENFNVLLYSFERYYDRISIYRIGDSGKIIVFDSYENLAKKYNKYQGYEN